MINCFIRDFKWCLCSCVYFKHVVIVNIFLWTEWMVQMNRRWIQKQKASCWLLWCRLLYNSYYILCYFSVQRKLWIIHTRVLFRCLNIIPFWHLHIVRFITKTDFCSSHTVCRKPGTHFFCGIGNNFWYEKYDLYLNV